MLPVQKIKPLHVAALNKHTECAELLINRGADIEAATERAVRPLHIAARMCDAVLVGYVTLRLQRLSQAGGLS